MPAPSSEQWQEIERLYRAGAISVRALADQFHVSEASIRAKARKHGWTRGSPLAQVMDPVEITRDDILTAAAVQVSVTTRHRKSIASLMALGERLQRALATYAEDVESLIHDPPPLGDEPPTEAQKALLARLPYLQMLVPDPVRTFGQLALSLRRLALTERLVYGIDVSPGDGGTPDQAAERLAMTRQWDSAVLDQIAQRKDLLEAARKGLPATGATNGHANGHANGQAG